MRKIIFIELVADPIEFAANVLQESMQAFVGNTLYRTVLDAALQPADLERKLAEILEVTLILQPVEIPLDVVDGIDDRTREVCIQSHLFQYVSRFKSLAISFQMQLVTA